jgi:hypothetical protein
MSPVLLTVAVPGAEHRLGQSLLSSAGVRSCRADFTPRDVRLSATQATLARVSAL